MKMLKITILIFLIFIAISISHANVISEYKTVINLDYESARIRTSMEIQAEESEISIITIPLSFYPEKLFIYDSSGRLNYDITEDNGMFIVRIYKYIEPYQTSKLNIEFEYENIKRLEGSYLFNYNIEISKTNKFELIINLPVGAILSDLTETSSVFPQPDGIGSDGQRIILRWSDENVELEDFRILVLFETSHKESVVSLRNYPILMTFIFGMIILGMYLFFEKQKEKVKSIGLGKNEKKIYDFIKSKGEIKQKEIQKELDFSKPRLSKLLRNLEEKGLIEKKPSGRTNVIKIKK